MAAGRPHGPIDPSLMSSLEMAVREARRPGPAELAWNWRWELGLLAGLAVPSGLIASEWGLLWLAVTTGAGLAAIAAAMLCWPPARQWCIAQAWCLITPHRVRAGCVNAWVQTRSGKLPFILATTPTAYGEQVRLWLRAGLAAADLHAARDVLAAACWAREVRVVPSTRHAHLVTLEVVRNHPSERTNSLFSASTEPDRRDRQHQKKEGSLRLTPEAWPFPRRGAGDGLGDTEDRDTRRWRGDVIPPPRFSPEESTAESGWRGRAHVPDDRF